MSSLDQVIDTWMRPESPWRQEAEATLPGATGFSAEMVRYGLPLMLEPLRSGAVARLLDLELGDRRVLDGFVHGRTAKGPGVVVHVLSGNIAGLAAVPISLTLAVKASTLVKAAQADRVFPELFARSIAEIDPELGAGVVACYWRGGERVLEDHAFAAADLVVLSGSESTVADARTRCRARFIGHGHRVSIAVATREMVETASAAALTAAALAEDVALWDQRGCLSPRICFIECGFESACEFAALLAARCEDLAKRLPMGALTMEEQSTVRRFRDEAEWRGLKGERVAVFASAESLDWTVVVDAGAAFRPTPLCRSLLVIPVPAFEELTKLLAPARSILEAAGVAAPPRRWPRVGAILVGAGVHWVTRIGRMQRPPLVWPQGGRPRVGDWVTWYGMDE